MTDSPSVAGHASSVAGSSSVAPPQQPIPELLQAALEEAARLLEADGAMVYLLDEEAGLLRFAQDAGLADLGQRDWVRSLTLRPGEGMIGKAVAERKVLTTDDYQADESFVHAPGPDRIVREASMRSFLVAPIVAADRVYGGLAAFSNRRAAFTERDAALVRALADHAGAAMANARLIEDLARSEAELERRADAERSLRELASRLIAIREPAELLQDVAEAAARLVRGDGAILGLLDDERRVLRWAYDSGVRDAFDPDFVANLTLGVGVGVTGRAVAEGRPIVVNDGLVDAFPRVPESEHFFEVSGFRSMIAAPIAGDDGPLGALEVYARREGAFSDADAALVADLAGIAAIAMTNVRLIRQIDRSREHLARSADAERTLREIAGRITAIRDSGDLLQHVVEEAARLVGAAGSIIDLVDRPTGAIRWGYDAGVAADLRERWLAEGMEDVASREVVATGRPIVSADYTADPRFPDQAAHAEFLRSAGIVSLAVVPIVTDAGVLGTLSVFTGRPGAFDEADAELLEALADHVAIAATNADLIERVRESEERYRFLVENAPDIVFAADARAALTYVSETVERLLGYRPDELVGRPFSEIIRYDDPSEIGQRFRVIAENPDRELVSRFRLIHRDGRDIPFEVSSRGLVRDGAFAGIYGMARDVSERDRLEQELRASEQRYRFLVENSPDIIFSTDAEGRYTYYSETVERLSGWRPNELIGQHFSSIVVRESFPDAAAAWGAFVEHPDQLQVHEFQLRRREGGTLPVEVSAIGMTDADGRFAGIHGAARDISDRLRLEGELRRQADELARRVEAQRTLAEMAAQIAALRDPSAVIQRAVDEALRLLAADAALLNQLDPASGVLQLAVAQAPADEVLDDVLVPVGRGVSGRAIAEGVVVRTGDYPNDPAFEHVDALDAYIERRRMASVMSAPLIASDEPIGTLTVQAERAHAFSEDDAVLLGLLADQAAIAIANAQLLERLQSSERRYRHLVDNSPDMIWSADAEGRFTLVSDSTERLFGYRPDEVLGRPWGEFTAPGSVPLATERWEAMRTDPASQQRVRLAVLHKDGREVPVEIYMIGSESDGRFVGAHGSVRDISERERLETDLRRQAAELASSDERAHLARELHDSVTQALFSMTLMTRSIELLLDRDPAAVPPKLAALRDLQRDALAEMRSLIFELRPGSLEQEGLVHALRTHAAAVQGRIGLPVVFDADLAERLPIEVEDALFRIAQEALHNIVKHASARQVRLALTRSDGTVRLHVVDDGKGFEPSAVPEGHLGLAGMRARAERIGAAFAVRSRPGQGTEIEIRVPVRSGEEQAASSAE